MPINHYVLPCLSYPDLLKYQMQSLIYLFKIGAINGLGFAQMGTNLCAQYLAYFGTAFGRNNGVARASDLIAPFEGMGIAYEFIATANGPAERAARIAFLSSTATAGIGGIVMGTPGHNAVLGVAAEGTVSIMRNKNMQNQLNRTISSSLSNTLNSSKSRPPLIFLMPRPGSGFRFSSLERIPKWRPRNLLVSRKTQFIKVITESLSKRALRNSKIIGVTIIGVVVLVLLLNTEDFGKLKKRVTKSVTISDHYSKKFLFFIKNSGHKLLFPLKYFGFIDRKIIQVSGSIIFIIRNKISNKFSTVEVLLLKKYST